MTRAVPLPHKSSAKRPEVDFRGGLRAALLGCSLFLSACAHTNDPNLTPAQNQLRQANANWNNTLMTAAVVGTASGAALGAAIGGQRGNAGTGALIGAGVGLLGGLFAGSQIADRNFAFAQREASAADRINNATAVANALEQQSQTAQAVVNQNRRTLADLDRQYRARQITAAEYRSQTETMRADLAEMRRGVENGRQARNEINRVSGDLPGLRAQEERIGPAQRRLEASSNELEELLKGVPAA